MSEPRTLKGEITIWQTREDPNIIDIKLRFDGLRKDLRSTVENQPRPGGQGLRRHPSLFGHLAEALAAHGLFRAEAEDPKVRENRLRRTAVRRGLQLVKSRSRDQQALDFGLYLLIDPNSDTVALDGPDGRGVGLAEIERYLNEPANGDLVSMPRDDAIRAVLRRARPDHLGVAEITRRLGLAGRRSESAAVVSRVLRELEKRGLVVSDDEGAWTVPD